MPWEQFGLDLEKNYRKNIRKFWHITKGLRDKKAKPVRNVFHAWRQYYQEKFSMVRG